MLEAAIVVAILGALYLQRNSAIRLGPKPGTPIVLGIVMTFLLSPALTAQTAATEPPPWHRQIAAGIDRDPLSASRILTALAENFGGRLTGSPMLESAITWASGQMKLAGLTGIHTEPWQLSQGWQRGHATARLLGPSSATLTVCAFGWTGSTNGLIQAPLAIAPLLTRSGPWRGKILLLDPGPDPSAAFFQLPVFVEAAVTAGALAVLVPDDRPGTIHTSPLGFPGVSASLPVLAIATGDIVRLRPGAIVELDVANHFTPSPIAQHNLVGEIPGTSPDAPVLLLGAHLDSWDIGPGATDDGYGVASVLAVARVLAASGLRPRATIRFVLFTGEEQGLLGSRAYLQRDAEELDRFLCAIVLDWGSGPIVKLPLAGHPELEQPLLALLQKTGFAASVAVSPGYLTYTDAFSFSAAGLAGLAPLQQSPNYVRFGHSAEDTLEHTDLTTLPFNVHLLASLAVGLADLPSSPVTRHSPAAIEQEMARIKAPSGLLISHVPHSPTPNVNRQLLNLPERLP